MCLDLALLAAHITDMSSSSTLTPFTYPRVGIGVMILREGKVLLGRRKGSHGAGDYSFPGGHFELNESFEASALREIVEECGEGLKIKNLRFICCANFRKEYTPKHYVQVGFAADWVAGEAINTEPEKLENWGWYDLNKLPTPLFAPARVMVELFQKGEVYQDQ